MGSRMPLMTEVNPLRDDRGRLLPGQSLNATGGVSRTKAILRQATDANAHLLVDLVIKAALAGDTASARWLIEQRSPPRKAQAEPVVVPGFQRCTTTADRVDCVVAAMTAGVVAPDVATAMLDVLARSAELTEINELRERVRDLELRSELMEGPR